MAADLDDFFDPERLRDRWKTAAPEHGEPLPDIPGPRALRDFAAARVALAESCRRSEGLTFLLDEAEAVVVELHAPETPLDEATRAALRSRFIELWESVEDLLEAVEIDAMLRPD